MLELSLAIIITAVMVSNYIFKVAFEVILTPVTYAIVGYLKRVEKLDVYDTKTNFNPFVAFWNARPWLSDSAGGDKG